MPIEMLKLHWKASRWLLMPLMLGAFAIPMVNLTGGPLTNLFVSSNGSDALMVSELLTPFYPSLAALCGTILALTAWNWDHQKGHVYPLSLPISRMRYSALKFGSGVVLLALPTAMLAVTALGVSAMLDLPNGLRTYPFELTARFFIAGLTAYAFFFALASGTIRTAVIFFAAVAGFLVIGDPLQASLAQFIPQVGGERITMTVMELLASPWGPLRLFGGNWMLIDV